MSTQRKRKVTEEGLVENDVSADGGAENSECKSAVFLFKHYLWCAEGQLSNVKLEH